MQGRCAQGQKEEKTGACSAQVKKRKEQKRLTDSQQHDEYRPNLAGDEAETKRTIIGAARLSMAH
jgi:hypothetical protein